MATPEIVTTQSVLGFLQWQPFIYQAAALNSPTAWQCTALPPGVQFNPLTGAITGPAVMPGVYNFILTASNASGTSAPVKFCLGIEASGFVQPSNILEVIIDLTTRRVFVGTSVSELQAQGAAAVTNTPDNKDEKKLSPLCWLKSGDDVIFSIRFIKNGVVAALSLTSLKWALKEFDTEETILQTDGSASTWQTTGSGTDSAFRLYAKVDGDLLKAALSNYDDDFETAFVALSEFEWTEANPTSPRIGPATIRGSSRTFGTKLVREIIPNPVA